MQPSRNSSLRRFFSAHSQETCLAAILLVFIAAMSIASPRFLTWENWVDLIEGRMLLFIFSLGLLVTLVSGGIDISFPIIASIAQYAAVMILNALGGGNWIFGIVLSIVVGLLLGSVNALLIYHLKVFSIIITIATQSIFFGLLMFFTNGVSIYNLPPWLQSTGAPLSLFGLSFGIPLVAIVVLTALTQLLLGRFSIGMQVYALGGNAEAVRRLGLSIPKLMIFAYGYLGALSGLAGLLQVYRVKEVVPKALYGLELQVLAAVVLGGASLMGGKGTVLGTFLGVLLLSIIQNALILLGVSSYVFQVIVGAIILIAVIATHARLSKNSGVYSAQ